MSGKKEPARCRQVQSDGEEAAPSVAPGPAGGVSRRVFIKGVACCLVAAALPADGTVAPEPLPLPAEPLRLAVDSEGFLVDPEFTYGEALGPTQRERLARTLPEFFDVPRAERAEWLEENLGEPTVGEMDPEGVDAWLEERVDPYWLDMWEYPEFTEYGAGIRLYQALGDEARHLGLKRVDGLMPCSDFVGVRFDGDPRQLNAALVARGIMAEVDATGWEDEPEDDDE